MVAIFRPDGSILSDSVCEQRKAARAFAKQYTGVANWSKLWRRGWRVRSIDWW